MASQWRTIGVLGGMGPAASADFYTRLVRGVEAPTDAGHPPTLIYSATEIPDRTSHLLGNGDDPTLAMIDAASRLQEAGAELLAIPCNSAHAYLDELRASLRIPVLDMLRLAAAACRERLGAGSGVGVLAATGTARLRLYDRALEEVGLVGIWPSGAEQEEVMAAVRSVKGGGPRDHDARLEPVIGSLADRGAAAALLACTELPLVLDPARVALPVIDATEALVAGTLDAARLAEEPGS